MRVSSADFFFEQLGKKTLQHRVSIVIGLRSVPDVLPSVQFPKFGYYFLFSLFSWKNKEEKTPWKKMFDNNGPKPGNLTESKESRTRS